MYESPPEFGRCYLELHSLDAVLVVTARPPYCDRGRFMAQVESTNPRTLFIDHQDGFPRYYFNLDRALTEMQDWLKARGQYDPLARWERISH